MIADFRLRAQPPQVLSGLGRPLGMGNDLVVAPRCDSSEERGATLISLAMLLAVICIAAVSGVSAFGSGVRSALLGGVAASTGPPELSVEGNLPGRGHTRVGPGRSWGSWIVDSQIAIIGPQHTGADGQVMMLTGSGSVRTSLSGLIPGKTYTMTFNSARHPADTGATSAKVTVGSDSYSWSSPNSYKSGFNEQTMTFTAQNETETLTFTGTRAVGRPGRGVVVDAPSIEYAG